MQVEVVGGQVAVALSEETMAREVNEYAVFLFRLRREPVLQLVAQVCERGFGADQQMHVFPMKIAAFGTDQNIEDVLGIALGVKQLGYFGILIAGNPHHRSEEHTSELQSP